MNYLYINHPVDRFVVDVHKMVFVSDQTKRERYSKAVSWLYDSRENSRNWTKEDIAFSHKVAYYVPKPYSAKDKMDIDDGKVFELMRFQGWKGKHPSSVNQQQYTVVITEEEEEGDRRVPSSSPTPAQEAYDFDDDEEKNPVVKFDGYVKILRGVLIDNIEYNSKDEEILRLKRQVQRLENEVSVLKRNRTIHDDMGDYGVDLARRKKSLIKV
jgi:hypothetical protein